MTAAERKNGGLNLIELANEMIRCSGQSIPPNADQTETTAPNVETNAPGNPQEPRENEVGTNLQPTNGTPVPNNTPYGKNEHETIYVVPQKPLVVVYPNAQDVIIETDNARSKNPPGRPAKSK